MKKKLLTVLLAGIMVFGVFSFAACGNAEPNPADEYNYYSSVYTDLKEVKNEDIRIHSMVFLQLEMMLRTPGNYLIYTGGAWDAKAQANIKVVNELAKTYNVQIYNLDLKLDGGISDATVDATNSKYFQETFENGTTFSYKNGTYMNDPKIATISTKADTIRQALVKYLGTYKSHGLTAPEGLKDTDIPEAALISIKVSAAPTTTTSSSMVDTYSLYTNGTKKMTVDADGNPVDANNDGKQDFTYVDGWVNFSISKDQKKDLVVSDSDKLDAAFKASEVKGLKIQTDKMKDELAAAIAVIEKNTALDAAAKAAAIKAEKAKDIYYVNGAFDVYKSTAESSTSSKAYNTSIADGQIGTDAATLAQAIQAVAITKPSFAGDLVKPGDKNYGKGPYNPSAFDTRNINTFDYFGDARLHMTGLEDETQDGFLTGTGSVYDAITLHEFIDILKNCKGSYQVFFGGAWCPNTQSIAKITSDLAKDYGIKRIFFFDPNLDGSASVLLGGQAKSTGMNIRTGNQADGESNKDALGNVLAKGTNINSASSLTFSGLYAYLLDQIAVGGKEYFSYWNVQWKSDMLNRGNRYQLFINGGTYTRMCVPNIMTFDYNETKNSGELVGWKEAEYYWADTSIVGNPYREAWENAVKSVFDLNAFAKYNPIPVIPEAPAVDNSGSGSTTGGAAGGGSSAC